MISVCRMVRAGCNLHATCLVSMLVFLAAASTVGCGKDEADQRPPGAGRSDIFGSVPPPAPLDAGARGDAGAGIGAQIDAAAPDSCANPDGGSNCPMLGTMKGEVAIAFAAKKSATMVAALERLATQGPAAYTNWASISRDGAAAAKAGDWNAVKASCRGCHGQYKDKYIAEHRSEPLHTKGTDGGT